MKLHHRSRPTLFVALAMVTVFVFIALGQPAQLIRRLRDLQDVKLSTTPSDGQGLVFKSSLNAWTNGTASGGGGGGSTNLEENTFTTNANPGFSTSGTNFSAPGNVLANGATFTNRVEVLNDVLDLVGSELRIRGGAGTGRILYSDFAGVASWLPNGPESYFLGISNGIPAWLNVVGSAGETNYYDIQIVTNQFFLSGKGNTLIVTQALTLEAVKTNLLATDASGLVTNAVYGSGISWNPTTRTLSATGVTNYDTINATTLNVGTINLTNALSPSAVSLNTYAAYAAGTAYSLTTTYTNLALGTTTSATTIAVAGTYLLSANVGVKYNGLTYVAAQTATFKLRRTNNTPTDISQAVRTVEMPVLTTYTGGDVFPLPHVLYTAGAGDIIEIYGSLSATPGAGTVDADSADIFALRIQ